MNRKHQQHKELALQGRQFSRIGENFNTRRIYHVSCVHKRQQINLLPFPRFLIDTEKLGDEESYNRDCFLGARQYCLKDPLSTLPAARVQNKM